jgi:hypothetical protein
MYHGPCFGYRRGVGVSGRPWPVKAGGVACAKSSNYGMPTGFSPPSVTLPPVHHPLRGYLCRASAIRSFVNGAPSAAPVACLSPAYHQKKTGSAIAYPGPLPLCIITKQQLRTPYSVGMVRMEFGTGSLESLRGILSSVNLHGQ